MSLLLLLLAAIVVFAVVLVVTYLTYRRLYDQLQFKPQVLHDSPVHVKIAPRSPSSSNVPSIKISHSLPEMKEVQPDVSPDAVPKKVAPHRQITLPTVPTRHLTFQRQLSHRLDMCNTVPFEVCNIQQRETHGTVGAIQPELYDMDGGNTTDSGRDSAELTSITTPCGKLQFTLKYDMDIEGLVVKILQAKDLPSKDFLGSSDPYIKLYLLPDRRKKYQTRVHRKNLNPVFNESFVFAMPLEELRHRTLQFSVYDFDRFSRNDLIGHVIVKRLYELCDVTHEMEYIMDIAGVPQDKVDKLGEVMLSLCYLPTAGRLTVTVIKARNLKPMDISGSSDPYIKVILVCEGKRIKKKKTSVKKSTLNPVFNEALVFDVPPENVDDVNLAVKVVDYDRVGPNELMGCCAVGTLAAGVGREHWLAVMDNPRKPTAQWYPLVDSLPAELDPPRTPSVTCLK
ncbi:synaptotagmin-10 [Ixodes scapularis]|uniref:synaptotagmin-10 n=1 Tax=Ixodes scapularis TaxID=6945 RepID=UPI001161698E|nr:synaptotagmin-10 [Ixodes scapularis]